MIIKKKFGGLFKQNIRYGVNITTEFKEYKKYRKQGTYLKWRKHFSNVISKLDYASLENFKRFCLNNESTVKQCITVYMAMISIFIPLYVSDLLVIKGNWLAALITYGILALISTYLVISSYSGYILSRDFYRDAAEIIQTQIDSMP